MGEEKLCKRGVAVLGGRCCSRRRVVMVAMDERRSARCACFNDSRGWEWIVQEFLVQRGDEVGLASRALLS